MLNTAQLNTKQLNTGPDLAEVIGGVAARAVVKWSYELRNKNGTLVAYLPGVWGGEYTAKRNQAHELTFHFDATHEFATYLTTANQVWLRDDTGALVQRFHIKRAMPSRVNNRASVEVFGQSVLVQWATEWVQNYDATDTVRNHLKAWLNAQTGSLPIRIGTIANAYASQSFAFKYDASRLRDAFHDMYDAVGAGDFYIDPASRRLNWLTRSGDAKGQRIKYGMNARGIVKSEDDSEQFTRLYLYGDGNGAERINLVDAGEANEYIQQDTGTYGIITEVRVMKEIKDAATLLAVANALLDRFSTPVISYEVDVVDYSNSNDGPDYSFERLRLGSMVKVIDDALGIEVTCKVVEIRHNLDNPIDIRVTLDNKPKDLRFVIRDLMERVETLELTPIEMATTEPPAVGTGTVGTSDRPARADHTHDIDPDALADLIENDTDLQDAIADTIGGSLAGDDIQPIGTANAEGDDTLLARADHVHKGNHFSATDAASLPAESDGADGVTTGASKRLYGRVNGAWLCLSHLE